VTGGEIAAGGQPLFVEALWAAAPRRRSVLKLWLLFSAVIALFAIIRLPLDLNFNAYAFGDRGSFLTVCYLAAHGSRPAVDFGYPYGLLAILVGQGWFYLFGLSPRADELAMLACGLAAGWGMARFVSAMRLGVVGVTLVVTALPFAILPSYQSFIYALEASVLCNALAEHAAGRRPRALALATAACLVKPSMGYVYGFIMLLLIAREASRGDSAASTRIRWREMLAALAPAAATGAILGALLAAVYGVPSLIGTLFPTSGRAIYRFFGYGSVLSGGRGLWYHPGGGIDFYLLTISGFWIAASVWLLLAGVGAGWRLGGAMLGGRTPSPADEFVFTCALLHLAFITEFFGGASSWEYYSYILVMGAGATSLSGATAGRIAALLALLALVGNSAHVEMAIHDWRSTAPDRPTGGLWASDAERAAWAKVLAASAGDGTAVVSFQGCAAIMFEEFAPPLGAYLIPYETLPAEFERAVARLQRAPKVFAVTGSDYSAALALYPELARLLKRREVMLNVTADGITFTVYGGPPL